MRIIFFIDSLGTGGAEKSMVNLAKFLVKSHDISFLCLDKREISYEEEVLDSNIPVIFLKGQSFLSRIRHLAAYIKQEQPDVVHSVLVRSNIFLRLSRVFVSNTVFIQSLVNTPYSLERKKDSKLPWQKFLLAKQFDKWTARFFPSFYHPITKTVLDHYRPIYNISDNYKIVYRGRNENTTLQNRKDSFKFTLINVGRQEFAKGQIDLLKALKYLEDQYDIENIYLKILGFKGKSSEVLQDYLKKNNLDKRVEILGFVRNVEEELTKVSVFVFPSYYEGLGGALIEAFAAKLPCICSDIPVLREVVGNENGALFSPPGDYKQLAENILKLYRDEDLRNELSTHSYSRFQEAFRMETINKEMLNIYKELLDRK